MEETTSLPISEETKERLNRIREPDESFDDVLTRLLSEKSA